MILITATDDGVSVLRRDIDSAEIDPVRGQDPFRKLDDAAQKEISEIS